MWNTLDFFISNLGFCLELRLLNSETEIKLVLELLNWLLKFFLCNPEVRLEKVKKEVDLLVWKVLIGITWGIIIASHFLYL